MEKNVEHNKSIVSIPIAFIIALVGTSSIALSIYLPWWGRLDATIGPMKTIKLYKSTLKVPFEVGEYVWAVRDPILRTAMLHPFLLMILSLAFSMICVIYRRIRKKKTMGALGLMSAAASITSFFVFKSRFETYLESIGETISGSMGYLHWGYGLGWKLSLVAAVLMTIVGLLQFFQVGSFEFEVVFEKETEDV